jgi:Zn finger protein HypA/HybF involved in hydrogenase expression
LVFANEKDSICPECGGMSDSIPLEKRFIINMMEIEK